MTVLQENIAMFAEAAHWVDELVSTISEPAWAGPGLGEWDMRALVGHSGRALLTIEKYLAAPAGKEELGSAEASYDQVMRLPDTDSKVIIQRGVDAGQALGESPATEFSAIVERVTRQLLSVDDRVIDSIAGGILLSNYLVARTCELVVHGLDIAHAANLKPEPPRECLSQTLLLTSSLAVHSGHGVEVLMALTGRKRLSAGFSMMP